MEERYDLIIIGAPRLRSGQDDIMIFINITL